MNIWRNKWVWGYGAAVLFAIAPLVAMAIGVFVAPALGCDVETLSEAAAPECPGGELVYMLFVSSWYALVTLPAGGAAFVILGIVHLALWYRSRRAKIV